MKFTLLEVFDAFIVVDNDSGEIINSDNEGGVDITLSFESRGLGYQADFDGDQTVQADGEVFYATTDDGERWDFRALTVVRLNDRPELR